ncbi:MAG: hypothetical protein K2Q06_08235, partial [Parvularculaceae bacterium]|nr:hypothetical protein [Parvularculaceae bacterium]
TEGAAATDDLDTIAPWAGIQAGQVLEISTVDAARDVVLKNGSGANRIAISSGTDLTLGELDAVAFLRWTGSQWRLLSIGGGGNPNNVATISALAALPHASLLAGAVAMVGEADRSGPFYWTTGDQSAAVTADPNQCAVVAPAAASSGSAGAWRRVPGPAGIFAFVCAGASDAAKVNNALSYASATGNRLVTLTRPLTLTATVNVPSKVAFDLGGRTVTKGAEVDMVTLSEDSEIRNGILAGAGATYTTSRGIVVASTGTCASDFAGGSSTTNCKWFPRIRGMRIELMGGPAIEFSGFDAGVGAVIDSVVAYRNDPNLFALKFPDTDRASSTGRRVINFDSAGYAGIDLAGARETQIKNSAIFSVRFGDSSAYTLTDASRIVRLIDRFTPTAVTQANSAVVTFNNHGLQNGDTIVCTVTSGMTQLNGNTYTVANRTTNTFELSGINSTGFGAWSAGSNFCDNRSAHVIRGSFHQVKAVPGQTISGATAVRFGPGATYNFFQTPVGAVSYPVTDLSGGTTNVASSLGGSTLPSSVQFQVGFPQFKITTNGDTGNFWEVYNGVNGRFQCLLNPQSPFVDTLCTSLNGRFWLGSNGNYNLRIGDTSVDSLVQFTTAKIRSSSGTLTLGANGTDYFTISTSGVLSGINGGTISGSTAPQIYSSVSKTRASTTTTASTSGLPACTEGTSITTVAMSPANGSGKVRLQATAMLAKTSTDTGVGPTGILFLCQSGVSTSLAVTRQVFPAIASAGDATESIVTLDWVADAGSTSSRTYDLRFATGNGSRTVWVNGPSGGDLFGANQAATLVVTDWP